MHQRIFTLIANPRATVEEFKEVLRETDLCIKDSRYKLTPLLYSLKHSRTDFTKAILQYLAKADTDPAQLVSLGIIDPMGHTPLMAAVLASDLDAIRRIMSLKPCFGYRNNLGENATMIAARRAIEFGDKESLDLLLSHPNIADEINQVNNEGISALMLVVHAKKVDLVKGLLSKGACPDGQGQKGSTALHLAAQVGAHDCLRELVKSEANLNIRDKVENLSALTWAVTKGDIVSVQILLEAGANPALQEQNGYTAILAAVEKGNHDCLRELVKQGNGLETANMEGVTPLIKAVLNNDAESVRILLEAGADPASQGKKGYTPIHVAVQENTYDCLRALVSSGKGLETREWEDDATALMKASYRGDEESVRILLEAGANPATQEGKGLTAYHFSVDKGTHDCLKVLVEKGIGLNLKTNLKNDNLSPLLLAIIQDDLPSVEILTEAGADIDLQAQGGNTAILAAIMRDAKKCLAYLAPRSSNLNIVNDQNRTALLEAVSGKGKLWAVELLLKAGADLDFEIEPGMSARAMVHMGKRQGRLSNEFCSGFADLCKKYAKKPASGQTAASREGASVHTGVPFHAVINVRMMEISGTVELGAGANAQYHDVIFKPGFKLKCCDAAVKITGSINGIPVLGDHEDTKSIIKALQDTGFDVEVCEDGIIFSGDLEYKDIKDVIEKTSFSPPSMDSAAGVDMFSPRRPTERRRPNVRASEFQDIKIIRGVTILGSGTSNGCKHLIFDEGAIFTCMGGELKVTETIIGIPVQGVQSDTQKLLSALRELGVTVETCEDGIVLKGNFTLTLETLNSKMNAASATSMPGL